MSNHSNIPCVSSIKESFSFNTQNVKSMCDFRNFIKHLQAINESNHLFKKWSLTTLFGMLLSFSGLYSQGRISPAPEMEQKVRETLKKNAETIRFMENKGQFPNKNVLYYFDGKQGTVFVEKNKIVFTAKNIVTLQPGEIRDSFNGGNLKEAEQFLLGSHTFTVHFEGANEMPKLELGDSYSTNYNFFFGNDTNRWVSNVKAAKDLTLHDIYPGIGLRLYSSNDGSLEFDWIISPGADYHNINMKFEGQDKLNIDKNGWLKVGLQFTDVVFQIPESYQVTEKGKEIIPFNFIKLNKNIVGFNTRANLNPSFPIVIDPTLSWGSYMDGNGTGGTFDEYLYAIQLDTITQIMYCAGSTNVNIPTSSAPYDANGYLNNISGLNGGSTPNPPYSAAVIYRINSAGNDLLDLTLYGPSSISSGQYVKAYSISLSQNRVFVGGFTTIDIPIPPSPAPTPFDGTRSNQDGFVAVFSKDLGTLEYATYLGSNGNETFGVTSIQALSDNGFVTGFTPDEALPTAYVPSTNPYQSTFGGVFDMYICRFDTINDIHYGTYIGGAAGDTLNDLEVLPNGNIIFAGWGRSDINEVNDSPDATSSTPTTNTDGIIGVLKDNFTSMLYLDEIGGVNHDRIFDIEAYGDTLYFTGAVGDAFPLGSGTKYDASFNGGTGPNNQRTDAIIGKVAVNGNAYKATYYGTSTQDLGNGIKQVTTSTCAGGTNTFLLVWGTVNGPGLDVPNLNSEPFHNPTKCCTGTGQTNNTDMFFAGFNSNLQSIIYGTYVGGTNNDYLGNVGDPRGSNHLFVYGSSIYVGTTIHSSSHTPNAVSGGFDLNKSNGTNDSHIIFEIEVTSIVETDFADAPMGKVPYHTIRCGSINLGTVDPETSSLGTNGNANKDDLNGYDDENSVANPPSFAPGGPQTISVTVDSITNLTGSVAYLYTWLNINGNIFFDSTEARIDTVTSGSVNRSKTFTWSNVTISGSDTAKYLRIRFTTDSLTDAYQAGFAVDDRSILPATDGEVEDYRCVELKCPDQKNETPCLTQDTVNARYTAWLATAKGGGGCDGVLTNNNPGPPDACGDTVTVTFTYTSTCAPFTTTCTSKFITNDSMPPPVVLTCPTNKTENNCQTQAAINSSYNTWLATVGVTGGCNTVVTNNSTGAPNNCGGSKTVTFTATSSCQNDVTCSATFTVSNAPTITLNCPANTTVSGCETQASLNTLYNDWLASATFSGGCAGATLSNNSSGPPNRCAASTKNVTFTVTDLCGTTSCTRSFTVSYTNVSITCPSNVTEAACQTQSAINQKFSDWLATASSAGGCNRVLTNNNTGAPSACGGSKSLTFTVTSDCETTKTCVATFTVTNATAVVLTCATTVTEAACQSQSTINTKFSNWLATTTASGGCNRVLTNNNTGAPSACGGSTTVTFTVTSDCEAPKTCSAIFTVTNATAVVLTCASNKTVAACQTQAAINSDFNSWLATTTASGGCNRVLTNNNTGAPPACGGSRTVTFTVTSDCETTKTCSATYTVTAATAVVLTCASNVTEVACQTQSQINTKYSNWLTETTTSGGCNPVFTNNSTGAPSACGGSKTVTWTVTSDCEAPKTCSATFTVVNATAVVITCPSNTTEVACQSQASIDAKYNDWLATASYSGGCNVNFTSNSTGAPPACGGARTVTFTATSDCEAPKTCTATFTVTAAPPVVLTCPSNVTEAACQTQAAIDSKYAAWFNSATASGGCNAVFTNNNTGAPPACGGSRTVTWTVTSSCETTRTCSATFTVTNAPTVTLNCPANVTEDACQSTEVIQSKFNAWLATASFTGGCNGVLTNMNTGIPTACGGVSSATFTVTSDCEAPKTCVATFTVGIDTIPPTFTAPPNITIYKSNVSPDTATLVNYDFNSGTSYASLCPVLFPEITSTIAAGSNIYKSTVGIASGTLAYTNNPNGGKGLRVDTSNTSGHWQFNIKGDNLLKSTNFAVYVQAKKNGAGSADSLKLQYSLNGTSWTTFRTKALTLGSWIQDTASVPGVSNPDSLFFRVTYSGGSGSSPKDLYLDNFQVRADVCCTYDPSPSITGDVTDEFDACNPNIQASYCDSLVATPCDGSHLIYRNWSLMDSCGNLANEQTQLITISDTSRPKFDKPADITIYKGAAIADTNTLLAYDFNNGNSYSKLTPYLYFGVKSKIDTSSVGFNTDTGTVTGALAFRVNNVAGKALRVDTSDRAGYWQFNVSGLYLPICKDFELYTQAYKKDSASADTLHYYYSLDSVVWNKFDSHKLTLDTWVQDTAKFPFTQSVTKLFFRITYSGSVGTGPAALLLDNVQLRAFVQYDSCGYDASPDITGVPTNVKDNCDMDPRVEYVDEITTGACPDEMIIMRRWIVTDDCNNINSAIQNITAIDTAAPTITCPPNVTVDCEQSTEPGATGFATGEDNCTDGMIDPDYSDDIVPGDCPGDKLIHRTWTVTDSCGNMASCVQDIQVDPKPGPFLTCPDNQTEAACQTQSTINGKFNTWLATASATGGCNTMFSNNNTGAPMACGGTASVTFTATSDCADPQTCVRTFTVTAATPIVLTCPSNATEASCQTQAAIDSKFNSWLNSASSTGGCNPIFTNSGGTAPDHCGGSRSVTFTVTSDCEAPKTCVATFTVTNATAVVLTCPSNATEAACQSQATINSKFNAWLATASATGGCNVMLTNNSGGTAPDHCGGSKSVTFTATSDCEAPKTCVATFTVTNATAVVLTCPSNVTEAACQTQAAIDSKFNAWLGNASFSGGCNGVLTNSGGTAPDHCGGSKSVTFTVTSDCEAPKTCVATFTVTNATAVVLTCPSNVTETSCQTQAAIDSKFNAWLATANFSGGCNGVLTNSGGTAPDHCGGSKSITFTVTSDCEAPKTCVATFTVTNAPPVVLTCPSNVTENACQTQSSINTKFNNWLATASHSGGCNSVRTNNNTGAPMACGGTASVTFTVTSDCEAPKTCVATFTVTNAPPVVLNCPSNVTENACQTQAAINSKFSAWLTTVSTSGGCNPVLTNNNSGAPMACGGSASVTFTVTSDCEAPKTCVATFTVTNAPPVVLTCPSNVTENACQTQASINSKFSAWLATVSTSGGCNPISTNNNSGAPDHCGGSKSVTFTVTSDCEAPKTCVATFTVTNAPPVVLTCASNVTENACQSQADINTKFNNWLNTTSFTGGCNGVLTNSGGAAPDHCGGTASVTFTVTSDCEAPKTCVATFTVTNATAVVLTCPSNVTEAACQTQADINSKFNAWLATASFTGGCNSMISNNNTGAPDHCGGSKSVTFTVTSDCEGPKTCVATFTVTNATSVVLVCPSNRNEAACQSQSDIDTKYNNWLATASFSGGCNGVLTNNAPPPPNHCGGSPIMVTFTVTSDCEAPVTCEAVFTVDPAPNVVLSCPSNVTENACQTQATINTKFNNWLATMSFTGGCNGVLTNNNTGAPLACGGTASVTFTVTSDCESPKTCVRTFTVTNAPAVVLNCPANVTENACQTQTAINSKFNTWITTANFSGGCNGVLTNSGGSAPPACGGSTSVTFTVTSDCEAPKTCVATFTVTNAPPVVLTCPSNTTELECQTQATINTKFSNWLASVSLTGGCNPILTNNNTGAPLACGGTTSVTFTVTSDCETTRTCVASFTVTTAPPVVLTCPSNTTELSCQSQATIDSKFANWLSSVTVTGGCNPITTNNNSGAPLACGGSKTVTFTVTSDCESSKTCAATFTVQNAPVVILTCPSNVTEAACQTQAAIDGKFSNWLNTFSFSGGCNPVYTNNNSGAPMACGGSKSVTFTVTSDCEAPKTCVATFTVTNAPVVILSCPSNVTENSCQSQTDINNKFNAWLGTASFTGGCNGVLTNSGGTAPDRCGGSRSVTFTVTSDCEAPKTCVATFTVTNAPAVILTCPANKTEAACQSQADIDTKYNNWIATAMFTGGCNGVMTNNAPAPPNRCGGSTVAVTFTVTSDCEAPKTCEAFFTVDPAPAVVLTCPNNVTEAACQSQTTINTKFNNWLATMSFTGGCNSVLTNNNTGAPLACGGTAS
ncbi:MAG TPA: hypothetical protein PLS73_09940, partial [Saprospiraceae bacterium]|nr:hypothetical protein [Saprospiraceae bacterium]